MLLNTYEGLKTVLSKGHFIPEEDIDDCFEAWKQAGRPNSFGDKSVGLGIGKGLPSLWSAYGHDLYLENYWVNLRATKGV